MKILHIYKCALPLSTGGIEHVIEELCRANTHHGHENTILCLSTEVKSRQIIHLPYARMVVYPQTFEVASCGFSIMLLPLFRALAKQHDLLHFQFPWPFADVLSLVTNKPYIVTYQSDIVRQKKWLKLYKPLMMRFLSKAQRVVASSPNLLENSPVLQQLSLRPEVIANGIDQQVPVPDSKLLEKFRHQVPQPFILFIGAFRYYKGIDILLEAAEKTTMHIVICGDGPLKHNYENKIATRGLSNVKLLGFVNEREKVVLLSLCRALVLPSTFSSEAYGMVLLEAARLAKPVISTELGTGTTYVNEAGVTGLVVPPGDADKLANAINTFNESPAEAVAMGVANQKRFLQHFTAAKMGSAYHKIYQKCITV